MGKTLIIKIKDNLIYLNNELFFFRNQTNLPSIEYLNFKSQAFFMQVEIVDFKAQSLIIKILDYDYDAPDCLSVFILQIPKKLVLRLEFEKMDWHYLQAVVSVYSKIHLQNVVDNLYNPLPENFDEKPRKKTTHKPIEVFEYVPIPQKEPKIERTRIEKVEFNRTINFDDLKFCNGEIKFPIVFYKIPSGTLWSIHNKHSIAELQHIKGWLAKKLLLKKVSIRGYAMCEGIAVKSYECFSDDLQKINEEFITSIKQSYAIDHLLGGKKNNKDGNKLVFSADSIFSTLAKEQTNVFNLTEKEIIDSLIQSGKIRNHQQITYLSKEKQSVNHPVKFTNYSKFGFLFTVEVPNKNYFILELQNSNATYIWCAENTMFSFEEQIEMIEQQIAIIERVGRAEYRSDYTEDIFFQLISHSGINMDENESFTKWKNRLNDIIG